MVQVKTEKEGIYRDVTNGALLNKDNNALTAYKKQKNRNSEIEMMKEKVNSIDSEVGEIKFLLNKILEKL